MIVASLVGILVGAIPPDAKALVGRELEAPSQNTICQNLSMLAPPPASGVIDHAKPASWQAWTCPPNSDTVTTISTGPKGPESSWERWLSDSSGVLLVRGFRNRKDEKDTSRLWLRLGNRTISLEEAGADDPDEAFQPSPTSGQIQAARWLEAHARPSDPQLAAVTADLAYPPLEREDCRVRKLSDADLESLLRRQDGIWPKQLFERPQIAAWKSACPEGITQIRLDARSPKRVGERELGYSSVSLRWLYRQGHLTAFEKEFASRAEFASKKPGSDQFEQVRILYGSWGAWRFHKALLASGGVSRFKRRDRPKEDLLIQSRMDTITLGGQEFSNVVAPRDSAWAAQHAALAGTGGCLRMSTRPPLESYPSKTLVWRPTSVRLDSVYMCSAGFWARRSEWSANDTRFLEECIRDPAGFSSMQGVVVRGPDTLRQIRIQKRIDTALEVLSRVGTAPWQAISLPHDPHLLLAARCPVSDPVARFFQPRLLSQPILALDSIPSLIATRTPVRNGYTVEWPLDSSEVPRPWKSLLGTRFRGLAPNGPTEAVLTGFVGHWVSRESWIPDLNRLPWKPPANGTGPELHGRISVQGSDTAPDWFLLMANEQSVSRLPASTDTAFLRIAKKWFPGKLRMASEESARERANDLSQDDIAGEEAPYHEDPEAKWAATKEPIPGRWRERPANVETRSVRVGQDQFFFASRTRYEHQLSYRRNLEEFHLAWAYRPFGKQWGRPGDFEEAQALVVGGSGPQSAPADHQEIGHPCDGHVNCRVVELLSLGPAHPLVALIESTSSNLRWLRRYDPAERWFWPYLN